MEEKRTFDEIRKNKKDESKLKKAYETMQGTIT